MNEPTTLVEAIRHFSDPAACLDFMVRLRWPSGITCPTCESREVRFLSTRGLWECKVKHRKRQFSVKVGTIFEDSPIGLDKWLPAIWMIANAKNGISSYEIARSFGITQKTAWFMLHRIRLAMQTSSFQKFSGQIEVDETFIGGKARFMHKDRRAIRIKGTGGKDKTAVIGLLERHSADKPSQVRTKVVQSRRRSALHAEVRQHVQPGSEVFTDAFASYDGLSRDYIHKVIDHAESYVNGNVHTNGMENFWSLLKRAIRGTYVSVEPFHLFRYLDEQAFRFNERTDRDAGRFMKVAQAIIGRRLTFAGLTT